MTTVVADIGGTHARFAFLIDGALHHVEKRVAQDYPGLADALRAYCVDHDAAPAGRLSIATAARENADGVFRFTNLNPWRIDRIALIAEGWHVEQIVNDFAASAYGALTLPPQSLTVLHDGPGIARAPRAILGPGTGLGLALAQPRGKDGWHIQETFGGHMAATAVTAEQSEIIRLVQGLHGDDTIIVPEDLISGRGLPVLAQAAALFNGRTPRAHADLLAAAADADVAQALRLFHEFLGLFAHNVAVTAHTFGGLYLDGGVIQRIVDAGLYDAAAFARFFTNAAAAVVHDALAQTPVWLVRDPFVALRGLAEMAQDHG